MNIASSDMDTDGIIKLWLVLLQGKIHRVSCYDPLDLFSDDPARQMFALESLVADPQNNLRLWMGQDSINSSHISSWVVSQQPYMTRILRVRCCSKHCSLSGCCALFTQGLHDVVLTMGVPEEASCMQRRRWWWVVTPGACAGSARPLRGAQVSACNAASR